MMDWDKLRIFHAVAEAGSFTHAGEMLNLSQSAVSRQISALEESLNVPLFHRHARGLILTEQGELLYRTAHEVFAKLAMAEAQLTESKDRPRGPLKVTATVALGSTWLTPRMKDFLELHPEVSVELVLDDRELDLGMREADVAIRMLPPRQPDLNWLLRLGSKSGQRRTPVLCINNVYAILRAVQSGVGIAALPEFMVQGANDLVRILPEVEGPRIDAYFVYPEELRNSKRIQVFRDFLLLQVAKSQF